MKAITKSRTGGHVNCISLQANVKKHDLIYGNVCTKTLLFTSYLLLKIRDTALKLTGNVSR